MPAKVMLLYGFSKHVFALFVHIRKAPNCTRLALRTRSLLKKYRQENNRTSKTKTF